MCNVGICVVKDNLEDRNIRETTILQCFFFPEGGVGLVNKCGCLLLTIACYAFIR
jgi:hypothetical protein